MENINETTKAEITLFSLTIEKFNKEITRMRSNAHNIENRVDALCGIREDSKSEVCDMPKEPNTVIDKLNSLITNMSELNTKLSNSAVALNKIV